MTTRTRTASLRRLVATGLGCVALGAASIAVAAPAGAATDTNATGAGARPGLHLTTEQKQCLKEHGVTRPIRPLTKEKVATIKAAVKACDIQVPARVRHRLARRAHHHVTLTAEQKQCLADHGVTRPIRPVTTEKIAAITSAAAACGVNLPAEFGKRVHLSDANVQCLKDHGVTFPVRPLTREKVQTIRDAAQACGIQRPARQNT